MGYRKIDPIKIQLCPPRWNGNGLIRLREKQGILKTQLMQKKEYYNQRVECKLQGRDFFHISAQTPQMRIGDQVQISGKKITPLKTKQIPASKKTEVKGKQTSSPKGQIIAQKISDQTTYFLLKTDAQSSPKWEAKEKIMNSYKSIIQKYERQQKAFLASQQQQVQRPPIVIQNSDESDEDKNKINGKRKLCIGGKAPILNSSGKKVCNESTKDGQPQNKGTQSSFSSKLQEMKSRLHESNVLQNENEQIKNNQCSTEKSSNSNFFNNANSNQLLVKRNNLFDSTNYYNTSKQDQNYMINNFKTSNDPHNNNQKISHRLLFDSQPVNPQINPKNQQKIFEKQVQKDKYIQQQLPVIKENSKNFSDIENISHLNNSISEEQKSDLLNNKNPLNIGSNIQKQSNQDEKGNGQAKSSSFGNIFFKKDDLQIVKSKSQQSDSPQKQQAKSQQQLKGLQKLITTNSPAKNANVTNNNNLNNNNNNNNNNRNNSNKNESINNSLVRKSKSSSSEEGKLKKSVDKNSSSKSTQQKLNDSKIEKKPSNENKKVVIPNLDSDDDEGLSQDDIQLKKKDFGKYIQQVFGYNKQTPKSSSIKNVYSPSKSPMIDMQKNKMNTQSQIQDSQIEGPQKDGPLNEVIQQNLQRLNEMIQNSEKKKLNKSNNSTSNNDEFTSIPDENNFVQHNDASEMDVEEKLIHQFEKERADYSQFQNQLIQEYIETRLNDENDELDEQPREKFVLQLEKGNQKQKQSNEITNETQKGLVLREGQLESKEKQVRANALHAQTSYEQDANKKQLQSTFESTSQEESKQGENRKEYATIYQEKKVQLCNTSIENTNPANIETNLQSTQAESICLNSEVQKKSPIPNQGHFYYGDKAKKVIACRPKENDIMMEIEWQTRSDGKTPEKSTLSSKLVREYDHDILIDFYESKIKFTYKNAIDKKKQTQSLNTSVKKEYDSPVQNQ
ncbi:hypothetical protein ABPG72_015219 [Tetrahymena utriculariae]